MTFTEGQFALSKSNQKSHVYLRAGMSQPHKLKGTMDDKNKAVLALHPTRTAFQNTKCTEVNTMMSTEVHKCDL